MLNNCRKIRKQNLKQGSFTVEAACVMPMILLVLFGLLYLCFFVHNRAWLTAAAYESALVGSMEAVKENGQVYEAAGMRSRELGNTGFFGAENLSIQTNTGKRVQVMYSLDTIASYGGFRWHQQVSGSSLVVRPVKRIRTLKAASEFVSAIGGE
ncbi:MAG: TadE/TadG family type IV pilus assembly protein [Blautia sp.]|nr:pilus assembly protein [Blautia sp.]MDY3998022.1 TadE/TadG family type IV pilus assembly protein [Blautia sp.]